MIDSRFERLRLLIGTSALKKLSECHVAVFGVGGVGGFAAEALARSGVGTITLVDHDTVDITNLNRQVIALTSTIGQPKVDLMKLRIADINPACTVIAHQQFFLPETKGQFDFSSFDYVVDAVDTITAKLLLIEEAHIAQVPLISSMGAGNKLDPTQFCIADISETRVCPLARVMRRELKKRNLNHVKVVYSPEAPATPGAVDGTPLEANPETRKISPGSSSFVPSVAGLFAASAVVRDLIHSEGYAPFCS